MGFVPYGTIDVPLVEQDSLDARRTPKQISLLAALDKEMCLSGREQRQFWLRNFAAAARNALHSKTSAEHCKPPQPKTIVPQ